MTNIIDALYLERRGELRLVSSVTFKGENIVFSVKVKSLQEAHDMLDILGVTCPKLESQLIDAGIR